MNHMKTETSDLPIDSVEVEFYPSVDDYVHIAQRVSSSIGTPHAVKYAYQIFLILNTIGFPAFLWLNEYYLPGLLIAAINVAALSWLIPWFAREGYRDYFKQVVGPREAEVARVN